MDVFALQGKVALVTGGARGIGAATVKLLARAGARAESLDILTGCDVTDEARVKAAFADAAQRLGGIDILVNNAGRAVRKPAIELAAEEWDQVLDLNLKATFV